MPTTKAIHELIGMTPEEVYGPVVDLSVFEEEPLASEVWSVGVSSDFVVVGHNSENADMSNPTGAIIRERYFVIAEDAKGHRRTWGGYNETPEAAEAAYALLAPPVAFWEETRPCYGSEAWTSEVDAAEAEAERADELASQFLNFRYER